MKLLFETTSHPWARRTPHCSGWHPGRAGRTRHAGTQEAKCLHCKQRLWRCSRRGGPGAWRVCLPGFPGVLAACPAPQSLRSSNRHPRMQGGVCCVGVEGCALPPTHCWGAACVGSPSGSSPSPRSVPCPSAPVSRNAGLGSSLPPTLPCLLGPHSLSPVLCPPTSPTVHTPPRPLLSVPPPFTKMPSCRALSSSQRAKRGSRAPAHGRDRSYEENPGAGPPGLPLPGWVTLHKSLHCPGFYFFTCEMG